MRSERVKERIKRIALVGMLTCLAFVLSFLESLVPLSAAVPGVKIGLANIVTLFAVYKLDWKGALFVTTARIALASFAFSGLFAGLYALCGGLLSLAVMLALKRWDVFSCVGVSICGGVSHNIGQLVFALFVFDSSALWLYMPVLFVAGALAGAFVGMLGAFAVKRIKININ